MQAIIVFVNTIKEHPADDKLEDCINYMNARKNTEVAQVWCDRLLFILIFLTCFWLRMYILSLKDEIRNQSRKAESCIDYNCDKFPTSQGFVLFFNEVILLLIAGLNSRTFCSLL